MLSHLSGEIIIKMPMSRSIRSPAPNMCYSMHCHLCHITSPVVVAQTVEGSPPTPEINCSNPTFDKIFFVPVNFTKCREKGKKRPVMHTGVIKLTKAQPDAS